MVSISELLVANVAEAGDIVLYAGLLAVALVVGLVLLGIDTVVGHLDDRSSRKRHRRLGDIDAGDHVLLRHGTKRLGDDGRPEHLQSYNYDPCRRERGRPERRLGLPSGHLWSWISDRVQGSTRGRIDTSLVVARLAA